MNSCNGFYCFTVFLLAIHVAGYCLAESHKAVRCQMHGFSLLFSLSAKRSMQKTQGNTQTILHFIVPILLQSYFTNSNVSVWLVIFLPILHCSFSFLFYSSHHTHKKIYTCSQFICNKIPMSL